MTLLSWNIVTFFAALTFFHVSEFALANVFTPKEVSWNSWLLSRPYCMAMCFGITEYCLEAWLMPSLKSEIALAACGLAMVLVGEAIRKTGMITAKGNFTHVMRWHHHPDHRLVTTGIYRFVRHPGYLGWFIWAIGTQVLLVNPVSTGVFAYVSWRFFDQRIHVEEAHLRRFFEEYDDYAARTPTLIPFIK